MATMQDMMDHKADHKASWRTLRQSGAMGRFALMCLGVWLHAADSLVTATLVPTIVGDIGGIAYVAWTIALYQIGAIVAGAATGPLCQRLGVKRTLTIAALVYALGCTVAALAPEMAMLLVARLIQGMGGGMLLSLSYIAIQQSFPAHLWSRLFGIEAAIWGAGSLLGPLIGGVFGGLDLWRGAFWLFAAQAGVLWLLATTLYPAQPIGARSGGAWPLKAIVLLSAATLLIAEASVTSHMATSILTCMAGLALLFQTLKSDARSRSRLFPAGTTKFGHPVGAGLAMVFALCLSTTGFWAYGPLLLKTMFGIEPVVSGYILAGESFAWSFATLLVSSARLSADRKLIRLGCVLAALGAAGLAVVVPVGSLAGMVVCALLQGLGFGFFWPSLMQRIVRFSNEGDRTLAAAAPGNVSRIGYAVGAAASGIAANMSGLAEGVSMEAARMAGFWVFAAFVPVLMIGVIAAWRFTMTPSAGTGSKA
jgi:MFS family permease